MVSKVFANLSKKLLSVFEGIKKRGILTPEIIDNAIREIRISLLEADVALQVVKTFTEILREKLKGQEVIKSTSPTQTISKYVYDEMVKLLGDNNGEAIKNGTILMCGLQGAGKTTTAAKLANMLHKKYRKTVLLVSLDTSRPAAVEQLQKLAQQNNIAFYDNLDLSKDSPISIAKHAMEESKNFDITIFDTAGRTYVDESLMKELREIHSIVNPKETFLVIDSMMGQDALNTSKVFDDSVKLTGLIATRIDGDNRGGACLSAKFITNCQIRYICVGEKIDDIELFFPDRIASRILDNGDILSFVEKAIDQNLIANPEDAKIPTNFTLNDMEKYFKQIEKIGGLHGFLRFLPGMGKLQNKLKEANLDEKIIKKQMAIIGSMTPKERRTPQILNASRRRRIAKGSGVQVSDVNKLLKQYDDMRLMMNKFKKLNYNPQSVMKLFR